LDGAQNIASACAIKDTIRENFRYKKIILVFGISKDKDIKGVCRVFSGLPDTVILTKANNPRAALTEALKSNFSPKSTFITQGVKEARKLAYQMAGKKDLVLVTGSLFIVGEFRNAKK
jgi:dihydrofolate synthase/folylpolyglutamate synthase